MFVFLDGNLAEVKRLLIPLDVQRDFEQRGGGVELGESVWWGGGAEGLAGMSKLIWTY